MQGTEAWSEGRIEDALDWLSRARRLAPKDQAVALALATIHLGRDPRWALSLAQEVVVSAPSREACLCLTAARHRVGETTQAIADLRSFLSRFAVDDAAMALAEMVCASSQPPQGWCGVSVDGRLVVRSGDPVRLYLDGKAVRSATVLFPLRRGRAGRLDVTAANKHLIGSPIDIGVHQRVDGFVEATPGGALRGWCWHPASPDSIPQVELHDAAGKRRAVIPVGPAAGSHGFFARRQAFEVSADDLKALQPPFWLIGADGRNLLGSPLDPGLESRSAQAIARARSIFRVETQLPAFIPSAAAAKGHRRGRPRSHAPAVVMPVFNGASSLAACLDAVIANTPRQILIIVVDDGSRDAAAIALLDRLAASKAIRLVRHRANHGFPAAANAGMKAAVGYDVVLLNSDVLTPPGWLEALRNAAYTAPDIGTASPFSNDATILSYPGGSPTAAPDMTATTHLASLAARAAGNAVAEIPTTVGFCMYIRRDCLDDVGLFREDLFGQGYGEENDFCLRARHLGWRHVAALGTYVAHVGGASFGAAKQHLIERNLAILERLHPGWLALIEAHAAADPLFPARRRLDRMRWRERFKRSKTSVILVTHDDGGGVERVVRRRIESLAAGGINAIVLRPTEDQSVRVYAGLANDLPDLRYQLPDELTECVALLKSGRPQRVEFHHTLGHHPLLLDLPARLSLPYEVMIHDYAWLCPRVTLVSSNGHYCSEPDARTCDRCVADGGRMIEEEIDTASLRRRSAAFLAGAAAVTTPSPDARDRLRRHFPAVSVNVTPHENDGDRSEFRAGRRSTDLVVAIVGALGVEKGYTVVLDCARDAADRALALRFVVVGHSIDDPRLLQTGRCFVTGPYQEGEAAALVVDKGAHIGFIPSIWPETWCFALSEIWRAGILAASFDIGAPAERIRATGAGFVLPLGLGAPGINNALLAAGHRIGHV